MAKLVVEVLDANDLMPKDGHGSASPFVEVEFEGQRKRTSTKPKNLNPSWNEKLVFNIKNPKDLSTQTIEVFVYNDNKHGHHKNFLGKVRISGMSVPSSEEEAMVQRYPLDKRGIFSHVKGDVALKVHALHGDADGFQSTEPVEGVRNVDNEFDDRYYYKGSHERNKKKKKERELRTFYSVGADYGGAAPSSVFVEGRSDFNKAGPVSSSKTVMQMQAPSQKPEYGVVETRPPLAARMGYWGETKLQALTICLDPYVEVKVGNYKGVTKHFEKNQNPVWNKIFAFSKERLQSSLIEITVKDKDISKDDFVGKITFDVNEVPQRVPPDSPLAPQWYKLLDKKGGLLKQGDIMLAVWMGTQADEAFPDAWHSDAHSVSQQSLNSTRSKVYFSPKLYYLRAHVIAAQDLVPADESRPPDAIVRVELGNQGLTTRPSPMKTINPEWNEELMYVAWEPFDEYIVERSTENRNRMKLPDAKWYPLQSPSWAEDQIEMKKDKFASRVLIRLSIDAGYHVLDESTQFSSDLQPSANQLRKAPVGILEVGILSARNLQPMKAKDGKLTDAYCVAKYGNKWVRTRTLLDNLHPTWNEQYTWEVFDPYTVITIGVFDNCHINGDAKDQRIGKPIHIKHVDLLRHQAMNIVAAKLARAEPPLRTEIVEYMLDVDYHMFSLRRSKANFHRMMSLVSGVQYVCTWFEGICQWKNPITTILVHMLFLILICYPELILPTIFIYLFVIGLWNYRVRPRNPPHMDARLSQAENANSDELDEEFDTFPTSRQTDTVKMRYDRLRTVAGRVQSVTADVAMQGERILAVLSWRDPRATAIFIIFSLLWAVFLYVTPFQIVALLIGLYVLRHPRFRYKLPPIPVNFFKRLPSRSDSLL
ncbi:hypothetical protein DH2020_049605 [Rehmannia glutinosa]|uniref:C2 domain-containing protein n=1 Tax=Rehmannia glutinosa TaxID=99300 RepID=A0ABR0U307_REHGL